MIHGNRKGVAATDRDAVGNPSPDQKNFVRMPFTSYASAAGIGAINDHIATTLSERCSSHSDAKLDDEDSTNRTISGMHGTSSALSSLGASGTEYDTVRVQGGTEEMNSATLAMPLELLSTKRPKVSDETFAPSPTSGVDHTSRGKLSEGVGLARLCRKVVILLTRSPACPDLVERQIGAADQRTYDQMEPLLAKAGMSYRDLHPARATVHGERVVQILG